MLKSKREREQFAVELYDQGKTVRQIAKEVHMSFRDIGSVIRRASEQSEPLLSTNLSKDSQALELFSQGRTPIEVTIKLDLKVQDVERLYKDYLRLSGLGKVASLYEEFKDCLPAFMKLYDKLTREEKLSKYDVEMIINHSREVPWLKTRHQKLLLDIDDLKNRKMVYLTEMRTLQGALSGLRRDVEEFKNDLSVIGPSRNFS